MRAGTRRLILLGVRSPVNDIAARLTTAQKLVLSRQPARLASPPCSPTASSCAVDGLIAEAGGPAWDADAFAGSPTHVRPRLHAATDEVVTWAEEILRGAHDGRMRLGRAAQPGARPGRRRHPRAARRPDHTPDSSPRRARGGCPRSPATCKAVAAPPRQARRQRGPRRAADGRRAPRRGRLPGRARARCRQRPGSARRRARSAGMIEELRVSLFAQTIGTPVPVSERRIMTAIDTPRLTIVCHESPRRVVRPSTTPSAMFLLK